MSNFDWQTEEDAEAVWHGDDNTALPPPRTPSLRLRRWLIVAAAGLLLLGGVGYWQVRQRITAVSQATEANILATHTLRLQVVADGDEELFRGLVSGRDMGWAETQIGLMKAGGWLARPAFRFFHQPASQPAKPPTITLAPDLQQAEVLFAEPYVGLGGEQGLLGQTAVYRQGQENRWLLAQPDAEFWGAWQTIGGKTITLTFPQRDQAVAERLLADWEADVVQACHLISKSDCPDTLALTVTFSTSADLLQRNDSRRPILLMAPALELPTPTLVGVPLDEAGYELLRQGYGGQVLTAVIAQRLDYTCCLKQHFFTALIDRQLSQLGVQPWPLTAAEYDQLLLNPHDVDRVATAWHSNRIFQSDWRIVYAAIEFLLTEAVANDDSVAWQQAIRQQDDSSELARLIDGHQLTTAWREEWLRFMYQHSASGQVAETQRGQLSYQCQTQTDTVVQVFDLATQQWHEVYQLPSPDNGYFFVRNQLSSLPDESGFLIEQWQNARSKFTGNLLIGRQGATFMLLTFSVDILTDYPGYYFTGETDPSQRYMVIATRKNSRLLTRHFVLDLQHCDAAQCQLTQRPFWFTWSPDGTRSLLAGAEPRFAPGVDVVLRDWQRPLFLGDANGEPVQELGTGSQPFWLDNQRYGTIRTTAERQLEFAVVNVDTGADELVVTVAEAAALLPNPPDTLFLVAAQPFPHDPNRMLLELRETPAGDGRTYLFQLDVAAQELRRLYQATRPLMYEMAENGRFLTVRWQEGMADRVWLVDVATGETKLLGAERVHWLENGRLLLREFDTHSLLTNPETAQQTLIIPPVKDCHYFH